MSLFLKINLNDIKHAIRSCNGGIKLVEEKVSRMNWRMKVYNLKFIGHERKGSKYIWQHFL